MDSAAAKKRCEAATKAPWMPTMHLSIEVERDPGIFAGIGCFESMPDVIFAARARTDLPAALEALEEAQVFRTELQELIDGDDSTLADQIRDLILNLDEGILRGSKEGE